MASVRTKTIESSNSSNFPQVISLDITNVIYLGLLNTGSNGVSFKIISVSDSGILYAGQYRRFMSNGLVSAIKLEFTFLGASSVTIDWVVGDAAPSGGAASADNQLTEIQNQEKIIKELAYQNDNYGASADYSTTTMPIETTVTTTVNNYFMLRSIRAKQDVSILLKYLSACANSLVNSSICIFLNPNIAVTAAITYSDLQIAELEEGSIEVPVGGETPNILTGGDFICEYQSNSFIAGNIPINRKFDLAMGDELVLAVYARTALDMAANIGYSKEKIR